jgi:hypothetical protein
MYWDVKIGFLRPCGGSRRRDREAVCGYPPNPPNNRRDRIWRIWRVSDRGVYRRSVLNDLDGQNPQNSVKKRFWGVMGRFLVGKIGGGSKKPQKINCFCELNSVTKYYINLLRIRLFL